MSLTTLTINAVDYVVYVSLAEANAYLCVDLTYGQAWGLLSDDEREKRIIAATRRLDLFRYNGTKTSDSQATEWPRTNASGAGGVAIEDDAIPAEIEQATYILAGMAAAKADALKAPGQPVSSVQVPGAISVTYRGEVQPAGGTGNQQVDRLIAPLLAGARSGGSRSYNVDDSSTANPFRDAFSGRNDGFS